MGEARPRLLVGLKASDEVARTISAALPGIPWSFADGLGTELRADVEAILVGSFSGALAEFDAGTTPGLQFVQRVYTGLDGFPFSRFPARVRVAGNVGAYAPYVAEQALALALAAARDLYRAHDMVRDGQLRPAPEQHTLFGERVSILGYGAIGREIARRLSACGARITGVDRSGSAEPPVERMLPAERFREALPDAAVVFDARPLTRRTVATLAAPELATMREDAILVNVGRAATVDPRALFDHLSAHPRFRAAFDVWWDEDYAHGRVGTDPPFATLPNFFATPHCASAVPGAERRALGLALENLARFFRDGRPEHVVDRAEYEG
jgi:phosphoglycerate dehydrogenase-like enzyme